MVAPGLAPPDGEVSDFNATSTSVRTAALAVNVFAIVATTALFAMRMTARHLISGMYALDDICCIVAYVGHNAPSFGRFKLIWHSEVINHGGGTHQWNVPETEVTYFFQSVYSTQIVYCPTVFATKASILFFLTRVFAPFERYCRFIYFFIGFMGFYYTLICALKIFICRPIPLFWNPSGEGECFDQRSLILADNIISLVTDIAVLIIPCPLAGGLKVALTAKLRIAAAFGAGGLACVCSFIRLIDIVKIGGSSDSTYSFTLINLFGIAEVGIGLICACFPVMPAFWKYLRNRHPSQITGGSYPTYSHGRSQTYTGRSGHGRHRRGASGIELAKKSHLSSTTTRSVSVVGGGAGMKRAEVFEDGSDESMLIPPPDVGGVKGGSGAKGGSGGGGRVTVCVRGGLGEDLEAGGKPWESEGDERRGGGGEGEDLGIVRTVEVQMMTEPK
ncbi:uncharacterized protein BKCO1_620008 [Diplodia corticola]|uniref:Integral membrane protein n=1 Tax=Diplodia corticola TaxID=236234 RepID=A0A1J9QN33_9PEZI|nr:uncharacterized protein BKCO1_620008 [Diplodia corticola]OJD30302.1 integral membrane protein [Diplodia corticola]